MRRLSCLDGLRGGLAVYVLISHLAPFAALPAWLVTPFSHGEAAVDVFFALSGLVILRSLDRFGWRPAPFLRARFLRIFPVFLAVFALAVAVQPLPRGFARMQWIGPASPARAIWSGGWPASWAPELLAHLTMTHGLFPNAVLPGVWVGFLGAAWSLSTEWQFYALLAALAATGGDRSRRGLVWGFLAVAAVALGWGALAPPGLRFSRAFLPNEAPYFALGLAGADLIAGGSARRYLGVLACVLGLCAAHGGAGKLAAPLVWSACLAAERISAGVREGDSVWHSTSRAAGARAGALLAAVLRAPPMLALGRLSYCLYLVNEPVQKLLGLTLAALACGNGALFTALWLPGAMLLPLAAAWLLHVTIEQPALRLSQPAAPRRTQPDTPAPIAGSGRAPAGAMGLHRPGAAGK